MKTTDKIIIITVFSLLIFMHSSSAASTEPNIIFKGSITNIPDISSSSVILYSCYGSDLFLVDSAPLDEKGKFILNSFIPRMKGLYKIGFDKENASYIVLSDQEKEVTITADYEDLINDIIFVNSSRENDAYRLLIGKLDLYKEKMTEIINLQESISPIDPFFAHKTKGYENRSNLLVQELNVELLQIQETCPDTFISDTLINLCLLPRLFDHAELNETYDNDRAFKHDYYFENVDFADEGIVNSPFLAEKYNSYLRDFTLHTPDGFRESADIMLNKAKESSAVLEFTIQYLIDVFSMNSYPELAEYVIDNYVEKCGSTLSGNTLEKIESINRSRVGQKAPEIISTDIDGNLVALSSMIGKKALMVYFWASWCAYCEVENITLVRIYNKFKERGFDIYAFAMESDKTEWVDAIKNQQLIWTNVSDLSDWNSEGARTYNISGTPTIYLLDEEGRIIARNLSSDELELKLEEILN